MGPDYRTGPLAGNFNSSRSKNTARIRGITKNNKGGVLLCWRILPLKFYLRCAISPHFDRTADYLVDP